MRLTDKSRIALIRLWRKLFLLPNSRKLSFAAAGLSLIAFGAAGVAPLAPDAADLPVVTITEELALPDLSTQINALRKTAMPFVVEERVRPGDNLWSLLNRMGVNDAVAANFIRKDARARTMISLRSGARLQASISPEGKLLSMQTLLDSAGHQNYANRLMLERTADGFSSKLTEVALEPRVEMRSGEIRSSFFAATDMAQLPDSVTEQLLEIFSGDIDFAADLSKGDHFQVIYESLWDGSEFVRSGRVLAAEFHYNGNRRQAIWFGNADGQRGHYYDPSGKSLKKTFLKSPFPVSRITSGFAMRMHPISGEWTQHKGIDFAAPEGTPVRVTADGVIDFSGAQNGYGNVVIVKHGSVYSTLYAHMSRIATGMRAGTRVTQGEVIGYVGTTGWSTGPHLHYEFRVNNESQDPSTIALPQAVALSAADLPHFRKRVADITHRFAMMSPNPVTLASR
jgi:murein DD-endopeptidase MepM/ murein hydrolase activator NlpD